MHTPPHRGGRATDRICLQERPGRVVIWAVPNASGKHRPVMLPPFFALLLLLYAAQSVRSAPTERAEPRGSESANADQPLEQETNAVFSILFSPPMPDATTVGQYEQADA